MTDLPGGIRRLTFPLPLGIDHVHCYLLPGSDGWITLHASLPGEPGNVVLAGHRDTGRFCHGDRPGLADCVLVPQIFNARRMDCRLDHVPTVMRVFEACMSEPAFASTQPSACPDAT